jgi:hypothetical protein
VPRLLTALCVLTVRVPRYESVADQSCQSKRVSPRRSMILWCSPDLSKANANPTESQSGNDDHRESFRLSVTQFIFVPVGRCLYIQPTKVLSLQPSRSNNWLRPIIYTGAGQPQVVATVPPGPKTEIRPSMAAQIPIPQQASPRRM